MVFVPEILTADEVEKVLKALSQIEWEAGKTLNPEMTGKVKKNQEIIGPNPIIDPWVNLIRERAVAKIGKSIFPHMFLPPKFNRCSPEFPEYGRHSDAPFMDCIGDGQNYRVRIDCSMTLWLTEDYDGGELCLDNGLKFKGKPGQAIFYRADQMHWVNPVTRGERICAITWMQSYFRNYDEREMLRSLHEVAARLPQFSEEQTTLGGVTGRLARKWSDT